MGLHSVQQQLTVLFSDIANSTWLYQQSGDVLAHQLIAECLSELTILVESHNGELLRTVGDSILASFPTADDALVAAVAIQLKYQHSSLSLRVGFHSGSVIPDRGDVYGNAVNIAARIASFAKPTEIYTSESTVQLLSQINRIRTGYLDRVDFKGVSKSLAVHRVVWRTLPSGELPEDDVDDTKIVAPKENTSRYVTDLMLELRIAAKKYLVDPDSHILSIGRSMDNDVVITHDSTSRNHAVIEFFHGKYHFRDTSTNGSYIVSSHGSTHFLRREQAVIEGFGIIGAGWKPGHGDPQRIQFRMVAIAGAARS